MSEMTNEQLAAIRNRADAATKGPWEQGKGVSPYIAKRDWVEVRNTATIAHDIRPRDAEFISAAREDVPALLAEVDRLRAALEALNV